jgi:hypothetical protein
MPIPPSATLDVLADLAHGSGLHDPESPPRSTPSGAPQAHTPTIDQ